MTGRRPRSSTTTKAWYGRVGVAISLIPAPGAWRARTGPAATRNRGAGFAQGEFVAFLDDDDEWTSDTYLEVAVNALRQYDADYLFGHLEGDRDGKPHDPGWVPPREMLVQERLVQAVPAVHELSRRTVVLIAQRFMIHPSNSIIRSETFRQAGGCFESLWSHAEDISLMLRVADRAKRVLYLPDTVARYPAADG